MIRLTVGIKEDGVDDQASLARIQVLLCLVDNTAKNRMVSFQDIAELTGVNIDDANRYVQEFRKQGIFAVDCCGGPIRPEVRLNVSIG